MILQSAKWSGLQPTALRFSILKSTQYNNMQPSGLIDFTESFASDSGQFTKYLGTGCTFSVSGGTGTISCAANTTSIINEGSAMTMPQCFSAVTISSNGAPSSTSFIGPGIAITEANRVHALYNGATHLIQIDAHISGTNNFSTGVNVGALTTPFTLGLSIVGNSACSWLNTGSGWQFIESFDVSSFVNLQTDSTSYFASFTAATGSGVTASFGFQNFVFGRFGGICMRDCTNVVNQDGTPYFSNASTIYFTATCADPKGSSYQAVFSYDLSSLTLTQTAVIMVSRADGIMNDNAGQIIYYQNGNRLLSISTWGAKTAGTLSSTTAIFSGLLTGQNILSGTQVVSGLSQLSLPSNGGGTPIYYDPFLIFDNKLSRWLIAYTTNPTFGSTNYYAAAAYSTNLTIWTAVGNDSASTPYEGTKIVLIKGAQYIASAGGYGISQRIYDKSFNYLGNIQAPESSGGNTNPHPMMFVYGNLVYMITFDGTQNASGNGFTWGKFITQTAQLYSTAAPYPLDGVSRGPVAAYSLRRLLTNYTGKSINVRRSSDNTTQDIGFTSGGDLDTTALLSFVGAGNGFITRWYDQSNNGNDAIQATTTAQPQVVTSGALYSIGTNSKPTASFNGSQYLSTVSNWDLPGLAIPGSLNCVIKLSSTTNAGLISYGSVVNNQARALGVNTTLEVITFSNDLVSSFNPGTAAFVQTGTFTPSLVTGYANGTSIGTHAAALATTRKTQLSLGSWIQPTGLIMAGLAPEFVIYDVSLSTNDRHILERNQGTYYGITVA